MLLVHKFPMSDGLTHLAEHVDWKTPSGRRPETVPSFLKDTVIFKGSSGSHDDGYIPCK